MTMVDLTTLSDEDLVALADALALEVKARRVALVCAEHALEKIGDGVPYAFEFCGDANVKPYLCRWVLKDKRLDRKFYDLGKDRVEDKTVINTSVVLPEGTVCEERRTWKRKRLLLAYEGGVHDLGPTDANRILAVKKYLVGDLSAEQLLELVPRDDTGPIEVPNDLQD